MPPVGVQVPAQVEVPVVAPGQVTVPATVLVVAPAAAEEVVVEVVVAAAEVAAIETQSKLERHSLCLWNPHHAPSGQFLLAGPKHQQKL